jgi:Tol biopolymer transport system component
VGTPQQGGANYDLFVMNTDGSGVANLTTSPEDVTTGFGQSYAQWSPDGSMIAYDGDDGLYVMNADGSDQRKLAYGASPT